MWLDFDTISDARQYYNSIRLIIDETKQDIQDLRLQLHDWKNVQEDLISSINTYLLFWWNLKDLNIAYESYIKLMNYDNSEKSLTEWFEIMDRYNLLTKDLILTSITPFSKRKLKMRLLSKRDQQWIQRDSISSTSISPTTKLELITYKKIWWDFDDLHTKTNFKQVLQEIN